MIRNHTLLLFFSILNLSHNHNLRKLAFDNTEHQPTSADIMMSLNEMVEGTSVVKYPPPPTSQR